MKQQLKIMQQKVQEELKQQNEEQRTLTETSVPVEPPVVESNGYIDYKVDFVASLSEDQSNSWDEEASFSEVDCEPGGEDYYDEECESPTKLYPNNEKQ